MPHPKDSQGGVNKNALDLKHARVLLVGLGSRISQSVMKQCGNKQRKNRSNVKSERRLGEFCIAHTITVSVSQGSRSQGKTLTWNPQGKMTEQK